MKDFFTPCEGKVKSIGLNTYSTYFLRYINSLYEHFLISIIPKTSTNLYCVDVWKGLISQPDVYSLAYSITTVKSYSSYNSHEWRGYFPSFPEQKILSGALTAVNVPCYYLWSTCHRVEHFFSPPFTGNLFSKAFFSCNGHSVFWSICKHANFCGFFLF